MGADLAMIGVGVDTSGLEAGEAALEKFAQEGERTEGRVKKSGNEVGGALKKVATDSKSAASGIKQVGAAAKVSSTQMSATGGAARNYASQVKGASLQTANLTAQFNDIGVMLAAGQNPLMLAMQQGTQINQVFQQMGGGVSAVKSLGPALMAMVSPVSLLTLGTIAGGAALVQWGISAIGAGEKALSLDEKIEGLTEKLSSWQSMLDEIADNEALADRFGRDAEAAKEFLGEITRITASELKSGFSDALGDMSDPFGLENTMRGLQLGSVADQLGMDRPFMAYSEAAREAREELDALAQSGIDASNQLATALDGGSFDQQKEAAENMLRVYTELADLDGKRTDAENEYIVALTDTVTKMQEFSNSINGEANKALSDMLKLGSDIGQTWAENVASQAASYERAQALVTAIEREAGIREAIAKYGSESAEVEALRADIARENLSAKLDELGVSEEIKIELMAAADAAWDTASAAEGVAGGIGVAADEAARLADNLFLASRVGLRQSIADEDLAMGQSLTPAPTTLATANYNRLTAPSPSSSRATGGASRISEAARELQKEKEELDRIAEQIIASTLTGEQNFALDFDEIRQAFETGRIEAKTYDRAISSLMEQFADPRVPQYAILLQDIIDKYEAGKINQSAFVDGLTRLNDKFGETQQTALSMEQSLENMFVTILNRSASASDAIGNLAQSLGNMALQAAFSGMFGGMFSGVANIFQSTRSAGVAALSQSASSSMHMPSTMRQNNAVNLSGQSPTAVSAPDNRKGGGLQFNYSPNIDATGADVAAIKRLEEGQARMAGEFEGRVFKAIQKGKKSRIL